MMEPRKEPPLRYVEERPWGGFEKFVQNEPVSVKRIWVEPGKRLSLQSHTKRSELWTVLSGSMEVQVGDDVRTLGAGDQVFIPCGAKHRATGLDARAEWLEIAFGIFDEDDIVRYEDDFGRA